MAKEPQDDAEIAGLLRRAWETGRRRWPQVDLPAEIFIRHVAGLLPGSSEEGSFAPLIERLDQEGLYLACACVNDRPGAIELLEQHYLARLPAQLGHLKLSAAVLDDVCQMVRTHLLVRTPESEPRLAEFTGRGALLIWMQVIAMRMARKQVSSGRETPQENVVDVLEALPESGPDAEWETFKRRYLHEFRQALREAFAALSSEQRYLLRLNVVDGLSTVKMAPLFGKDQSTISRWLKEAREKVYEETKRLLQERLQLSSKEFKSHTKAIKSRLDVSLSQLLKEEDDEDDESDEGE